MPDTQIDDDARTILNFMRLDMPVLPSDIIVGLGSLETRVAERAAELYLNGYGKVVIFTGATGRMTAGVLKQSEAETFRDVALSMGVPADKILLETAATNTGANFMLTEKLINEHQLRPQSIIFVTKPYMERRAYATYKKQWHDQSITAYFTSPQLSYDDHFAPGTIPKDLFINVLVSDLQRIKEYPRLGYQITQTIPADVWAAYERLVSAGYNQHLL